MKASQISPVFLLFCALLAVVGAGRAVAGDVGVVAVLAPVDTVDSATTVTPRAVVANFGSRDTTFRVVMRIGSLYSLMLVETLSAGQYDTVRFLPWTASPVGFVPVTCHTALVGDTYPANDTVYDTVYVRRPLLRDAGVVSILAPTGGVDSGATLTPRAVVRNYGLAPQVFPVTMRIGATYTQQIQDTLDPLKTDTVSFPSWTALVVGLLPVTCHTGLTGDERPENDTIRTNVQVLAPPPHDVGTEAIIAPAAQARTGDTIYPVARIRNYGQDVEQNFAVRFRIGANYNRTVTVLQRLLPDSSTIVTLAPWIAVSGRHAVSCSTMLSTDVDSSNNRRSSTVEVTDAPTLDIGFDQSGSISIGDTMSWRFYAELAGGEADVAELVASRPAPGWAVAFYDSAGRAKLTDTDADGRPDIGLLYPGFRRYFSMRIQAPSDLSGDISWLDEARFSATAFLARDTAVRDSVFLTVKLIPKVEVHNYPNPFSGETRFVIGLPERGTVDLVVYDRNGACVSRVAQDSLMNEGVHSVKWNGLNTQRQAVAPGTYEYVLDYKVGSKVSRIRKKLVVTKE